MSNVKIIAFAFFIYVGIRLLNRSDPAVSHSISLIVLSSRNTFLVIKSIPTVGYIIIIITAILSSTVSYLYL